MSARALILSAALVLAPAAPGAAQTISIAVDGVPRQVPVLERQGRRFVALEEIAALLGGRVSRVGAESATLTVDGRPLEVLRRVPYVAWEGRWYQMPEPAQKDAAGFWVPAEAVRHLLPVLLPGRFPPVPATGGDPRPAPADRRPGDVDSGMIGRAGDPGSVHVRIEPGRTRLGFRLASMPGVVVDDAAPRALRLRVSGAGVPVTVARGLAGVGLVDSVGVTDAGDATELVLWTAPAASVWAVAPTRRPAGFEVTLLAAPPDEAAAVLALGASGPAAGADARRRATAEAAATPGGSSAEAPAWSVPDAPREPAPGAAAPVQPRRGGWKLVVDAGHGGHDPGARGPGGTREKEVTLRIARALARALEERGVDVVLTRADDTFVPLGERTRIANRERADLFVSIHANSATNSSAEGFETYFLSAAKSEDAARVARMENAAIRFESPTIDAASLDDLNFILRDLAQNEFLRESSELAETVQEELDRRLSLRNRGVKQAPFFVLNGAFMPAILFETAFISNPREESLLNDAEFRSRLVEGLAASILDYLERYGRKTAAPVAAR